MCEFRKSFGKKVVVCSKQHERPYWKNKRNKAGRGWGITRKPKKG